MLLQGIRHRFLVVNNQNPYVLVFHSSSSSNPILICCLLSFTAPAAVERTKRRPDVSLSRHAPQLFGQRGRVVFRCCLQKSETDRDPKTHQRPTQSVRLVPLLKHRFSNESPASRRLL